MQIFQKGGGMVQIGGVPWIIVEDIFTLTHFGVPIAPSSLKLPQPYSVLSQHKMFKWATNARTKSLVTCVVSAAEWISAAI